jgi:hypothetical protein
VQQAELVKAGLMETLPKLQEDLEFSSAASLHMLPIPSSQ